MSKTPEQYIQQAQEIVKAKEDSISQLHKQVADIEGRLASFSQSPSIDNYEAIVKDQIELSARQQLVQRIARGFNPKSELDFILNNTKDGKSVLEQYHAAKSKLVDGLRAEASRIRSKALAAEEKGQDSFELNEKADGLLDTIDSYSGELRTASNHLSKFPAQRDSVIHWQAIYDRLAAIN